MKDAIDIRDTKRRIASSVIKWWDVKYLMDEDSEDENSSTDYPVGYGHHSQNISQKDSAPSLDEDSDTKLEEEPEEVLEGTVEDDGTDEEERKANEMMSQMSEEDRQAALDIIERLNREAFEDDLKKSMEIEMLKAEMNNKEEG